jgi:hypothetical protein
MFKRTLTRFTRVSAFIGAFTFLLASQMVQASENSDSELSTSSTSAATTPKSLTLDEIAVRYFSAPATVGQARLKIMFWKIYDAHLVAPEGAYVDDAPFALSLTYLRDFDGEEIASRSVDEMRDLGYDDEVDLAKWFEQMRSVFPNVKEGENITGVLDENRHTHFYHNGKKVGTIDDKTFGQSFFDIWLSDETSEPEMREQLLGLN